MADKKITQLTNITGANLVDADEFVVVDISADETKAITLGELKEAFDSGSGFVRITGDTMTGALDVQSTITADGLTVDGKTTTDELDLNAIAATISDTAVDIFVYDTRKDSDGGAWRKRTQGTSWYNETLNTATRGSRKEFPAVAVIVAESNQVTIYDGDDPALPMWMVFNNSGLVGYTASVTSLSMINGVLSFGGSGGLFTVKFLSEIMRFRQNGNDRWQFNISSRNTLALVVNGLASHIVNPAVNDVAMTVLPNAPIDAATGLPVPTIAVATDGGVSVIKDDGTVVDITSSSAGFGSVDFFGERLVYSYGEGGVVNQRVGVASSIPSNDTSSDTAKYFGILEPTVNPTEPKLLASAVTTGGATAQYVTKDADGFSVGAPYYIANTLQRLGVSRVLHNSTSIGNSSVSYITSDYNTGWMNGDIKLATLSDTDATNVTGSELVTNGTFDTDTSGWNVVYGTLTYSSGQAVLSNATAYHPYFFQTVSVTAGQTYVLSVDITAISGQSCQIRVFTDGSFATTLAVKSSITTTGTHNITFTATGSTHYIRMAQITASASDSATFDNISVRLAEEDRSVNGNGLQVFGTVTKSAVATGADLVSYTGYTGFLQQPHIASNEIGSGDACSMIWFKTGASGVSEMLISFEGENYDCAFNIRKETTNQIKGWASSDGFSTNLSVASGTTYADNVWHHAAWVKRGTKYSLYIDGELKGTGTYTNPLNYDSNNEKISIGRRTRLKEDNFYGVLSLARFSHTAPSAAQIAKIYNDEKYLFTEGAQATLYGSSDSVTALAYDTDSELLHVGTSAGRSVFQGLRRVNNTTNAVGAAISASNGMIVEE